MTQMIPGLCSFDRYGNRNPSKEEPQRAAPIRQIPLRAVASGRKRFPCIQTLEGGLQLVMQ